MDPIKLVRFQKVARYILSALFIVCVYHEAGPWTAISLLLIFIGSERQHRLNGIMIETINGLQKSLVIQKKVNDALIDSLANVIKTVGIHREFHKKERNFDSVLKEVKINGQS